MTEYGRIHTDGSRSGGQPVLLPCPFCGGRAEIAEIETEDLPLWLGECQEPPCEAVAPVRPTRDEAIAAWNTRQPKTVTFTVVSAADGNPMHTFKIDPAKKTILRPLHSMIGYVFEPEEQSE